MENDYNKSEKEGAGLWRKFKDKFLRMRDDDGSWGWVIRILLWSVCILIGLLAGYFWYWYGFEFFFSKPSDGIDVVVQIDVFREKISVHGLDSSYGFFRSGTSLLLFGLVAGISKFFISTHDKKKELNNAYSEGNALLFHNSIVYLLSGDNPHLRSEGLVSLMELKHSEENTMGEKVDRNTKYAAIREARLAGADLSRADLSKARLPLADLSKSNLRFADLSRSDLTQAILVDADLVGANLENADLTSTILSGAKCSRETTKFPNDFDKTEHDLDWVD